MKTPGKRSSGKKTKSGEIFILDVGQPIVYDKILMAQAKAPLHELNGEVDELAKLVNNGTDEEVMQLLRRLVPNYQPR